MSPSGKITLQTLCERKRTGTKFSVLTCYDVAVARVMASAGVEVLLVGDTAGEVILGLPSTREIDPGFLIALTAAVRRGAPEPFVMADLPHACRREGSTEVTVDWTKRFFEETSCNAVKIEVTGEDAPLVEAASRAGVPVVAHLGLLPQQIDPEVGYRAQGCDAESARAIMTAAKRHEEAGASMLLLEAVAGEVAGEIASRTDLPVIGCVAGPGCDGTVVVLHDMIGLGGGHPPRGVRRYADLSDILGQAFAAYVDDIQTGRFPTNQDAPRMKPGEFDKLLTLTGEA
jgi:3-methyl-2-oxobutanoate hydroxymethyltransferase